MKINILRDYLNFYRIKKKYIKLNKEIFKNKNKLSASQVLIEFNAYSNFHVLASYLVNFLSDKFLSKIIAFNNYSLISHNFNVGILKRIKFFLGSKIGLGYFGIYKSFGTTAFILPKKDAYLEKKAKEFYKKNFFRISNKNQLCSLKCDGIKIGDLIHDGYLKYKKIYTFELYDKDFQEYFCDALILFFFFKKYFLENNVKAVVGCMAVYPFAISLRVSILLNIPTFTILEGKVYRHDKNNLNNHQSAGFKNYRKIFKSFNLDKKNKLLKQGSKILNFRMTGKTTYKIYQNTVTKSSFHKNFQKKNVLIKNKKIKILILTHEYFDAPNAYGGFFFPNHYEWVKSLLKFSFKNSHYDWYIKDHPSYSGKIALTQKSTHETTKYLIKKFNPNVNYIDPDISHHQIVSEGINFVCTVHGSPLFEYSFYGVPVIPASINHPCIAYNFVLQTYNKKEYFKKLKNLTNLRIKINIKEIFEFYYMHFIFFNSNSFYDKFDNFMRKYKKYEYYYTPYFYKYWYENWNIKDYEKKNRKLNLFYNSKDYILTHTN